MNSFFNRLRKLLFGTKTRIILTVAMLIIIAIVGWRIFGSAKQPTQYQTAQAEKGTLIVSVSESGQVSIANRTSVTTAASGVVSTVYVKEGDSVTQGQKIADIALDRNGQQQADSALASYLSAQNNLTNAQTQLNSLQSTLFQSNQAFITDRGVDNPTDQQKADPKYIEENDGWLAAEANYKNQQNVIAQAVASLNSAAISYQNSSSSIVAPAAGTLTDLTITQGMQIVSSSTTSNSSSSTSNSSTIVANIKTNGNPVISVNLSEIDVTKVKAGDKVTITLDALPDKTFTGKVVGINTTGTVSSGVTNYPTTILLDTPEDSILPNMSATANIITDVKDNTLLIPTSAITTSNGVSSVRVLKNGNMSTVEVTTGEASDLQTEITSGLSEGDTVITSFISTPTTGGSSSTSPFSRSIFGGGAAGGGTFFRAGGGSGAARGTGGR